VVEAEKYILTINGQINSKIGKRIAQEDSVSRLRLQQSEKNV
jgi:hypothetical protein